MTSVKPYLVRAWYEWMMDQGYSPHLVVTVEEDSPEISVPMDFVEDGKIVFCIDDDAVLDLKLSNHMISFTAGFSGEAIACFFPVKYVDAIYAEETGRGAIFPMNEEDEDEGQPPQGKKPVMRVIKDDD